MKFNAHLTIARSEGEARARLAATGCAPEGMAKMAPKLRHYAIKLEGVSSPTANILKQEMLSLGGEAAILREALTEPKARGNVILMGTVRQLRDLARKLKPQPFGLKALAEDLPRLIEYAERTEFVIPTRKGELVMKERPLLMGIVNVTPDSFYDGGRFAETEAAVDQVFKLAAEGADLIDVGGESTRPGAEPIPAAEELKRVIPVIEAAAEELSQPISIDTRKAEVAREALQAGAAMVNDVSALGYDPDLAKVAAEAKAPLILMHIQGTPKDMQQDPHYDDLFGEIIAFLRERIERAKAAGVAEEMILVDPGIGFGKTVAHNLELIRDLWRLRSLGRPIVLGPSNKSFIGKVLNVGKDDRAEGSAAAAVAGVLAGAHILRVHDVGYHRRFVEMAGAIRAGCMLDE